MSEHGSVSTITCRDCGESWQVWWTMNTPVRPSFIEEVDGTHVVRWEVNDGQEAEPASSEAGGDEPEPRAAGREASDQDDDPAHEDRLNPFEEIAQQAWRDAEAGTTDYADLFETAMHNGEIFLRLIQQDLRSGSGMTPEIMIALSSTAQAFYQKAIAMTLASLLLRMKADE